VIPALIRKFHEAKVASQSSVPSPQSSVVVWGTGTPRREFLYSDDVADACIFLMSLPDGAFSSVLSPKSSVPGLHSSPPLINIGSGEDLTVRELADLVKEVVGYEGKIRWDETKPDGTPRKLLDVSRLRALGWKPITGLREGITKAYEDYLSCLKEKKSNMAAQTGRV
jgi:GDP-L-fucose synthase